MRDPIQALLTAIERDRGGIAVVWCPDAGLRDWLIGEVESLASPESSPIRVATVEEAVAEPKHMVMLVPLDERQAVLDLDGSRDQLLCDERSQPVVLFLNSCRLRPSNPHPGRLC